MLLREGRLMEYRILTSGEPAYIQAEINRLAAQGWRLVGFSTTYTTNPMSENFVIYSAVMARETAE